MAATAQVPYVHPIIDIGHHILSSAWEPGGYVLLAALALLLITVVLGPDTMTSAFWVKRNATPATANSTSALIAMGAAIIGSRIANEIESPGDSHIGSYFFFALIARSIFAWRGTGLIRLAMAGVLLCAVGDSLHPPHCGMVTEPVDVLDAGPTPARLTSPSRCERDYEFSEPPPEWCSDDQLTPSSPAFGDECSCIDGYSPAIQDCAVPMYTCTTAEPEPTSERAGGTQKEFSNFPQGSPSKVEGKWKINIKPNR